MKYVQQKSDLNTFFFNGKTVVTGEAAEIRPIKSSVFKIIFCENSRSVVTR